MKKIKKIVKTSQLLMDLFNTASKEQKPAIIELMQMNQKRYTKYIAKKGFD